MIYSSSKKSYDLLIQEARSWIGTRFQHQGRVKKGLDHLGGCDCLGLVIGIAKKFKLKSKLDWDVLSNHDPTNYSRLPYKNNLLDKISTHLSVAKRQYIKTGDVGLFRIGKYPQHLGIFIKDDTISMIHSYQDAGYVVENSYSKYWESRLIKLFSFNELSRFP